AFRVARQSRSGAAQPQALPGAGLRGARRDGDLEHGSLAAAGRWPTDAAARRRHPRRHRAARRRPRILAGAARRGVRGTHGQARRSVHPR
nr:hypothetical protein [Tanacetum cinerariifolium]